MNGVRTISRRKGYLLTALAAAVLLAASSGTAWAQDPVLSELEITLEAPRTVAEGGDLTITVKGTAMVAATTKVGDDDGNGVVLEAGDVNGGETASNRTVSVDLEPVMGTATGFTPGELPGGEAGGQVYDAAIVSNPRVILTFSEYTGTGSRKRTVTGTITVRTNEDADAEGEAVMIQVEGAANTGIRVPTTPGAPASVTNVANEDLPTAIFRIIDDETQTYVLTLDQQTHTSINPPMENAEISVNIEAKPAHFQGGTTLTLQLSKDGGRAAGYSAFGDPATRGSVAIGTVDPGEDADDPLGTAMNKRGITIRQGHDDEDGDGNRVTDTITLEAHAGAAGRDSQADSLSIDVLDLDLLPAASAITAVAKDKDGNVVTEIMEGGDPVYLTLTVDRGKGASDRITDEELTVDIRASDAGQVSDYDLTESRIALESRSSGKQTNDMEIMLSALSDEDVGMEYLMLNLELSGDSDVGTETSTGTFSIGIVDNTMKKVEPKAEADAYPAILDALKAGSGDDGDFNPGESFSVMAEDLFDVADGYTASYGVSVEGGAVSVSASSDSITVDAKMAGEAKVTITATAKMAASSFLPEQTMSDVAKITFAVMVVEGMTEPVPALPLFGQLLLALFLMAGGARLYRRRQG